MARKRKKVDKEGMHLNRTLLPETTIGDSFEIPAIRVPRPFAGFIDFVRTQGVVGLGVGFIVGTSANTLIKSIVTNIINPVVGWLTGGIDLSQKSFCIDRMSATQCKSVINYGQVISDVITFVAILAVVYFAVKSLRLEKLDKPKKS